jgi:Rrf2 family protein
MKVNTKVRYGLRAILQVADAYGGEPVPVSAISQTQEISGKYLEQVIGALRRAELVLSRKGVRGGYTLARDPKEISLWEIISALDNQTALVDCVIEPEVCDRADDCLTRSIWTLLSRRMEEFWSSFTLADLLTTMREAGDARLQQLAQFEKGE